MLRARSSLVYLAFVSILAAPEVRADTLSDGHISGEVLTITGSAIPGAAIVVSDRQTGYETTITVDDRGGFRVPFLQPGDYVVSASSSGYDDAELVDVNVKVGAGTQIILVLQSAGADERIEEIEVIASSVSKIDLFSSETVLTLGEAQIDLLPIARDTTAVILLTPGAVPGDESFLNFDRSGRFASLGGASVAENAFYINGMNVTNFRDGLESTTIPFEFFQEFQVKYSGISAEYGRATGGFVNTVTKRGSNEFKYGAGVYIEPSGMQATAPDVIGDDGQIGNIGRLETRTKSEGYVYASGPIVRDRLFFYGIYNPRELDGEFLGSAFFRNVSDDAFWGAKLDFELTPDHAFELTAFSDEADYVSASFNFDPETQTIGEERGDIIFARGGTNWILEYSGSLGRDLSLSVLTGQSEFNQSLYSLADQFPVIFDTRAPNFFTRLGSWVSTEQSSDYDERDLARIDLEWSAGRHLFRAGFDYESNTSFSEARFSGDVAWVYWDATPGGEVLTGTVPDGVTQVAQRLQFARGGSFDIETTSWYLEDSFSVTRDLTLNVGIRNEVFENFNAAGESFIRIDDQWAPRVGMAWDIAGNGASKLYASYGRYHLPVASSINIRLAGGESSTEEWWVLDGLNPDDTPQLGPQIGDTIVLATGEILEPDSQIDRSIEPMYQDELALGYELELGDRYIAGISVIRRDLKSAIEDVSANQALIDYAQQNGFDDFAPDFFGPYILTNPGTDMSVRIDLDNDGVPEEVDLAAEALGIPAAVRKYTAVNLFLERVWSEGWQVRADYTWSKSYGNFEGAVSSETGNDIPGFNSDFDFRGLMEGAYGDLPNDRRHAVKVYGSWQFRPRWVLSGFGSWTSGKPESFLSLHPSDAFAAAYGAISFYTADGELAPRGSAGRMASIKNLDLSLRYELSVVRSGIVTLQLDAFNVFDWDSPTRIFQATQLDNGDSSSLFGLPRDFQRPRSVRISARLDFE